MTAVEGKKLVHLLDYGTGNIRSVVNAIESVGFEVVRIASPADFASVEVRLHS
jgi:imidazoleglycerol phosphate synthase glutamine amidotransferase subunit HisH